MARPIMKSYAPRLGLIKGGKKEESHPFLAVAIIIGFIVVANVCINILITGTI